MAPACCQKTLKLERHIKYNFLYTYNFCLFVLGFHKFIHHQCLSHFIDFL